MESDYDMKCTQHKFLNNISEILSRLLCLLSQLKWFSLPNQNALCGSARETEEREERAVC